jgi:CubicO group peptidase (beta-lactamase class C family)
MSGPGDQVDTKAIDDYINAKMKVCKIPGLALSIVKNNQIVYLKGYGRSNVRGKPVTPQTPFYIASVYKSFIGLGISQLIDAGKISIDTPVKTYLPWFTLADPEAAAQITIKHLLSHTSGLSTRSGVMVLYTNPVSLEKLVRNQANTRISQPVGTKYQYSNLNYFILALVIQTVSGMPYGQYIETNIFKPLDMLHSYTSQAKAKKNGLATGYTSFFGLMIPFFEPERKASIHLMVSAGDMAHYMVAQLNNGCYGGDSVISRQGMARTHIPLFPAVLYHYGMGWAIKDNNIAHNGAMQNFRADVFMRNSEDGDKWGATVLVNSMDMAAFDLTGEVPYGNVSSDIVQLLRGEKPSDSFSPFKITFSNIGKVITIYLQYLLAATMFLGSTLRNNLRSR